MVIDTSAIIAIILNEPEKELFSSLISSAVSRNLSVASLLECSIVLSGKLGSDADAVVDNLIAGLEIEIMAVSIEQAQFARIAFLRYGKGRHPAGLNFGDCFSYALAKATGEPLLCKGEDFRRTDLVLAD